MAKPIQGIQPFTGKSAEWMTNYLASFKPDLEKQREVEEIEQKMARRVEIKPR